MSFLHCATAFALLLLPTMAFGGAPVELHLGLDESVRSALQASPRLKSAEAEIHAASNRAGSQEALLWPKVSLEANWRYISEVPNLPLPGPPVPFGDNESYSIGPALSWTAWDGGVVRKGWRSLQLQATARTEERIATERQLVLSARMAYFRVLQAAEQLRLVADSVRLAQSRSGDILKRRRAGAASEVDLISARREVLSLQLQFRQTQSELAEALRDLFSLTGTQTGLDLSRPVDARIVDPRKVVDEEPTLFVRLDTLDDAMKNLLPTAIGAAPTAHPKLSALALQADSMRLGAEGTAAAHWPRLGVYAKSSYDYPNGPQQVHVTQNLVGLSLSWNFFEGERISRETAEKNALADAAEQRVKQAEMDLSRDWHKAVEKLGILKAQRETHRASIHEAERLVELVYQSYRAGRSSFLEVQSANLAALDARIRASRNEVQILIQAAIMAEIAGEK